MKNNVKVIENAKVVLERGIIFDGVIVICDDRICAFGKAGEVEIPEGAECIDACGAYVGPGFVDIHVHGGNGYNSADNPEKMAEYFLSCGETSMLLTSTGVTRKPVEGIVENIEKIKAAAKTHGNIKGIYMEGPFFNPNYGANKHLNVWGNRQIVEEDYKPLVDAGADFIIYSVHDGYGKTISGTTLVSDAQISDYYSTVLSDGYVDIVFEGHTHRSYVLRDGEGVYHLQNSGDNGGISYAEAVINFANGESRVREAKFISSSVYSSLSDDPIIDTLMEKYKDQVSEGERVLGYNCKDRDRDELRRVLAQLYLETGLEAFGKKSKIVLGGAYMTVRSPGYLPQGSG